jgi:hypothetical protein
MKGTRFSEKQIIGVLREHEAGVRLDERNLYDPDLMKVLDFKYYSVGRPPILNGK